MTRREMILGAGALVGSQAVGSPVRSILGTVGAEYGEAAEPFVNPYVTDGLVAMWDGIWNVGFGKHNSSSTIWKDLVGNRDLMLRGTASFTADRLQNSASNGSATYTLDAVNGIRSFEIGFVVNNERATILNIGEGIYLFYYKGQLWCNGRSSGYRRSIAQYSLSNEYHMSFVTNGDTSDIIKAYNNAVNVTVRGSNDYWQLGNCCNIGGYYTNYNDRALDGSVMYVRLYSRVLTDEEISFNHAIDKVRFGL